MKREKREGFFAEERSRFPSICESWSLNSNRDIHQPLWSYGFLCFQVHCLNSPFIEAFACWSCTLTKIKSALFGSKVRVWILFIRLNLFFCGFFFLLMCSSWFQRTKKVVVWVRSLTWILDCMNLYLFEMLNLTWISCLSR